MSIAQIEKARCDLTTDITSLGVDCNALDYHCQIQPTRFEKEFAYRQISDDEISENDSYDDEADVERMMEVEDQFDYEDRHTLSEQQQKQIKHRVRAKDCDNSNDKDSKSVNIM